MAPSLFLLSQPTWTPLIMGKAKSAMPKKSQTPTSTGRNDTRDLLTLLTYAEKLQETQQHLEEVCSLMQHTVPLEGLSADQIIEPFKLRRAASRDYTSELKLLPMLWSEQLLHSRYNSCMRWHKPTAGSRTAQTISRRSPTTLPK